MGETQPATVAAIPPLSPSSARPGITSPVMLGIDVLESDGFAAVRGKRIGLLTHAAGVNRRGESTIDVLRQAPGRETGGALCAGTRPLRHRGSRQEPARHVDARTGLPVYSLYGKTRKPTKEMLKGLDALVIDLQDIGVRSYTYRRAPCARRWRPALRTTSKSIVLDRPNPLGGLKVDGPPMDADLVSYVGAFRVPYVHGLTIGELARMAAAAPGVLVDPGGGARARGVSPSCPCAAGAAPCAGPTPA